MEFSDDDLNGFCTFRQPVVRDWQQDLTTSLEPLLGKHLRVLRVGSALVSFWAMVSNYTQNFYLPKAIESRWRTPPARNSFQDLLARPLGSIPPWELFHLFRPTTTLHRERSVSTALALQGTSQHHLAVSREGVVLGLFPLST